MRTVCLPVDSSATPVDKLPVLFACLRARFPRETALLVYARICCFANEPHGCFMSINALATDCGRPKKFVRDTLDNLVKEGAIVETHECVFGVTGTRCFRPAAALYAPVAQKEAALVSKPAPPVPTSNGKAGTRRARVTRSTGAEKPGERPVTPVQAPTETGATRNRRTIPAIVHRMSRKAREEYFARYPDELARYEEYVRSEDGTG